MYGANTMKTQIEGLGTVGIKQETDYPWDGTVKLTITQLKGNKEFDLKLRIPEWAAGAKVSIAQKKGITQDITAPKAGEYLTLTQTWSKGDVITLTLPMETRVIEANPLVEECRGQVAVQRGPILYCLGSNELNGMYIDNISSPVNATFTPVETTIEGSRMMALETEAVDRSEKTWTGTLYRTANTEKKKVKVRLIPYYAWGNRGKSEMTVWMPAVY